MNQLDEKQRKCTNGIESCSEAKPAIEWIPRPRIPDFVPKTEARHGWWPTLRRSLRKALWRWQDSGWLGASRLDQHLVICGFPRSGSTLLHLMIHNCVEGLQAFPDEEPALWTAWHVRPTQPIL